MPLLEFVDDQFMAEFAAMRERLDALQRRVDSINGPGISNGPDGISFHPPEHAHADTPTDPPLRYATGVKTYNVAVPNVLEAWPCDANGNRFDTSTGAQTVHLLTGGDGLIWVGGTVAYLPTPGKTASSTGYSGPVDGVIVTPSRYCWLQRVGLTKTGGSAGSASAVCSFTYDVSSLVIAGGGGDLGGSPSSGVMASGVSPEMSPARIFPMTASPATVGMAYWGGTGWVLAYAHETAAGVSSCS